MVLPTYLLPSNHNLRITSNVYTYMLQHEVLYFFFNSSRPALIRGPGGINELNSLFAIAPPNVKRHMDKNC